MQSKFARNNESNNNNDDNNKTNGERRKRTNNKLAYPPYDPELLIACVLSG